VLGIELLGVRVSAAGGFDTDTWESTGIDYAVQMRSPAPPERLVLLLDVVDAVAEILAPSDPARQSSGSPDGARLRGCAAGRRWGDGASMRSLTPKRVASTR
jgi:hypothetical protein